MLVWRTTPREGDPERVRELVQATAVFSEDECDLAAEIVEDRLLGGPETGYEVFLVERGARLVGYASWGPIPGTVGRFDLYWIAVDPELHGRGLGHRLMARVEEEALGASADWMFVDTSSLPRYEPAWRLYRSSGYRMVARIPDFFAPGDSKLVFSKRLRDA